MRTIPENINERRTIGFDPTTKCLTWGNTPEGDYITHKQLVDFELYLLDLGIMDEGSPVLHADYEVMFFLWNAYKDTVRLNYAYDVLRNHIPGTSCTQPNRNKITPVQRHCIGGNQKPRIARYGIARGFFNTIRSIWESIKHPVVS